MDGYSQHGTALRGADRALDMMDADVRGAAASPVLPLALSAQLGLDPADLVALRSDFFPHTSAQTAPQWFLPLPCEIQALCTIPVMLPNGGGCL